MDSKEATKRLEEVFGSPETMMGMQVIMLSQMGQPCDITFHHRKPILDVTIEPGVGMAMLYGAGPAKIKEMLENIKLSNGEVVSMAEIWTIVPLPKGGFSPEELAAVDLDEGEKPHGPNGETLRQMIRETYHCATREEEDHFVRRWIAS